MPNLSATGTPTAGQSHGLTKASSTSGFHILLAQLLASFSFKRRYSAVIWKLGYHCKQRGTTFVETER